MRKALWNPLGFFINDEFHKNMLEEQQIGLSYYLYAASVNYSQ